MQSARCYSPFVLKPWFRFPSIFRRAVFWLRLWRAIWLVLAVLYATAHLSAIHLMSHVVFGGEMPPAQMMAEANTAVTRYPFDPYVRGLRRYVRVNLERIHAIGERPTAPVHGSGGP